MKIIENLNLNILRLKPSLILLWYECWLIYLIWALPSWWPVSKVVSSQSLLSTIYSFILVGESRNLFLKQFSFILMINSGPHSTAFLVCRGEEMEPSLPLIEKQGGVPFFWPDWLVLCYNLSVEWHSLFSWQLGLVKLSVKWLHFVITVWNIQIIFISRSLKIKLFCQQ